MEGGAKVYGGAGPNVKELAVVNCRNSQSTARVYNGILYVSMVTWGTPLPNVAMIVGQRERKRKLMGGGAVDAHRARCRQRRDKESNHAWMSRISQLGIIFSYN